MVQSDVFVVSPRVQGYVREVLVGDNQPVKAGEVIVAIEDRDFTARVLEARARTEARRGALRSMRERITRQRAVVDQAAAGVAGAEAEQRRAAQDYARYQALARSEVASPQRLEAALADSRKADAALRQAQAALKAETEQMSVLEAERSIADGLVSEAEAALEAARIDLDATLIRAPVDGIVGNRGVQVGQLVKPGTQLLSVVPISRVYVVANFKETQFARLSSGQDVEVEADAFPGQPVFGHVDSFAPATESRFSLLPPENATGNFVKVVQRVPVRITLQPEHSLQGLLRPGLSVKVAVQTQGAARAGSALGRLLGGAEMAATAEGG
jgi:membrane fusion protein (multidrug efflux system)